jgi:parvulin-like peptidyl-prolyl isomerase
MGEEMFCKNKILILSLLSTVVIFNNFAKKLKETTKIEKVDEIIDVNLSEKNQTQINTEEPKTTETKKWVIDKIIVLINGTRILKSDVEKPRISRDGGKYSLEELIQEELLVQRAVDRHMLPSEADIERQVVAFKLQNGLGNLTNNDFEEELKKFGFTLKEYKLQIGRLIASENIKRMEVTDKIVITSQEVETYYNSNEERTPEEHYLKMIPVTIDADKTVKMDKAETVDLNWVKKEDLDPRFEFVLKMKKGEISETVTVNDRDYVIDITDKKESRIKTLDERYEEIEKNLIKRKQEKLIKRFEEDLLKNSTIIKL